MNLRSPVKKPVLMVKKFQRQHIIGAILLIFALVFSSFAVSIRLAGSDASWQHVSITTNSVTCAVIFDETNLTVRAVSEVESAITFAPCWDKWHSLPYARLDIWVEVVADGSNVVSLLFGTPEAPALTVACGADWSLCAAGNAPLELLSPTTYGITTQELHIAIYQGRNSGMAHSHVRSRNVFGTWQERPDLALTDFGWIAEEQLIANWDEIELVLAGPAAMLRSLLLRWAPDATLLILK